MGRMRRVIGSEFHVYLRSTQNGGAGHGGCEKRSDHLSLRREDERGPEGTLRSLVVALSFHLNPPSHHR